MRKKALAVLLSGALCAGCFPGTALAADNIPAEKLSGSQILEETLVLGGDVQEEASEEEQVQEAEASETAESPEVSDTQNSGETSEASDSEEGTDASAAAETGEETDVSDEAESGGEMDASDTAESGEETGAADEAGTAEAESAEAAEESAAVPNSVIEDEEITLSYKIYLPEGYDSQGTTHYPTVYLMPYDGYDADIYVQDGIQDRLDELMASDDVIDMIVVMPEFEDGDDYRAWLPYLVDEVDSNFMTIDDTAYRGIMGVNVGGYMAMETGLISQSDLFYAVGSHMGDFTSEANPYIAAGYGSVADTVNGMDSWPARGYTFLSSHYFYIDGPNGDISTTETGGTAEIGAGIAKRTNPYWSYGGSFYLYSTPDNSLAEYNVLDGQKDSAFYLENLGRSLNRFSRQFTKSLFSGSLKCTPQAVTSADTEITASVNLTMTQEIGKYLQSMPEVTITVELTDPQSGSVIGNYTASVSDLQYDEARDIEITIPAEDMADGLNTTVNAYADFMGMTQSLGSLSLVSVADTDENQIDLMGDWYFKAYKQYVRNDTSVVELDKVENVTEDVYTQWDVVQPGLGWWTDDFSDDEGFTSQYGGYAWYVRTFEVPEDFATEGLVMATGYFDEANEVFINGVRVGSTGMDYTIADGVGVYDGSNPWETNCVYDLDSSVLKYGETNTIKYNLMVLFFCI